MFLAESSLISLTRSMINPAKSMIILSIAIETTSSPERIEVWMWSTVPFVASGQALKLSIMENSGELQGKCDSANPKAVPMKWEKCHGVAVTKGERLKDAKCREMFPPQSAYADSSPSGEP